MQLERLFLLDVGAKQASVLDPLDAALTAAGQRTTRLIVPEDSLDGSDAAALHLLDEIRNACAAHERPVLIGVGLGASLALWVDALDLSKPKRVQLGPRSVTLEHEFERTALLSGVVAIAPFLGFDFSMPTGRFSGDGLSGWRLKQSRGGFLGWLLGRFIIGQPAEHGCWVLGRLTWAELAKVQAFASVAQVLPSLKRPTVLILDAATMAERIELELCALSAKVSVMDSPVTFPQLAHVTLAAVDSLLKGAGSTDG